MNVLEYYGVYEAKWSLKGEKPIVEQMKRKHSRCAEEVSVDTHP